MNIQAESYGHALILNLSGELNADSLEAFRQTVDRHLEGKEVVDLVLNLASVPFIDSEGLECLLDLQDRLAERLGQVKLVRPGDNVATVLEMTRLKSRFEIYRDVPEAAKVAQS
jgi:anti-anti-sigma factor